MQRGASKLASKVLRVMEKSICRDPILKYMILLTFTFISINLIYIIYMLYRMQGELSKIPSYQYLTFLIGVLYLYFTRVMYLQVRRIVAIIKEVMSVSEEHELLKYLTEYTLALYLVLVSITSIIGVEISILAVRTRDAIEGININILMLNFALLSIISTMGLSKMLLEGLEYYRQLFLLRPYIVVRRSEGLFLVYAKRSELVPSKDLFELDIFKEPDKYYIKLKLPEGGSGVYV